MIDLAALALTAGEPAVVLDMGPVGAPLLTGFSRVHAEGSDDARVSWAVAPDDVRLVAGADPLATDFAVRGTLHLALPAGAWRGWAMMGGLEGQYHQRAPYGGSFGLRSPGGEVLRVDVPGGWDFLRSEWYMPNPLPVFVPGEGTWDRQVAPRTPWRPFEVQVGDEGLDLEIHGLPLQALVMVPSDHTAEGEVATEVADRLRRAWYHERLAPDEGGPDLPEPGTGPMRVDVTNWRELPTSDAAERQARIGWHAAPGERVSAVLWVFGDCEAATWTIEGLTELRLEGHEVQWADGVLHWDHDRMGPGPGPLRPSQGELVGGQGLPVGLGIIGWVPEGASGSANAVLRLSTGTDQLEISIDLRVRELDLAPAPEHGFFYDLPPLLADLFGYGSPEVMGVAEQDYALMRARGATLLGLRQAQQQGGWSASPEPDLSIVQEATALWQRAGGTRTLWMDASLTRWNAQVFNGAPSGQLLDRWLPQVSAMERAARDLTAVDLFVYDEAVYRGVENPDRAREMIRQLRAAGSVSLAGAIPHPAEWDLAADLDVGMVTSGPTVMSQSVEWVRSQGAEPWTYNLAHGRCGSGLTRWHMGSAYHMQWIWNDAIKAGDPFHNPLATPWTPYAVLSPQGEVWSTAMLESWTEGLTDLRYLRTLDALVTRIESMHRRRLDKEATRARALLDAAHAAIEGTPRFGHHAGDTISEQALQVLRVSVGDEAERLQALLDRDRLSRTP